MCGILGIYGHTPVAQDLYNGLLTIQHRGQDNAGIATFDGQLHLEKGNGLVNDIFNRDSLIKLNGNIGVAHVRYPTVGPGGVENAQPFIVNAPFGITMSHNGNVSNFEDLKKELFQKNRRQINSTCDVEVILNVFAHALQKLNVKKLKPEHIWKATDQVFERVKGAYSVIGYIVNQGYFAFRDPHGIRPIIMGERESEKGKEYIFASENVAIQTLKFKVVRDLEPGEALFIDNDGKVHTKIVKRKSYTPCIFEYVYFARPDTMMNKISVYKSRLRMGEKLADRIKKKKWKIDVVVPVPDSSKTAALPLAYRLGVKYREGLIKNRYIGRTFIMPDQAMRQESIRFKLNPVVEELKDKNVLLVDDSIVRGNTSRKIVRMVKQAGAKKVYFAVAAPPLKYPCLYGIDLPSKDEYIANFFSVEEIRKEICADELIYQTLDDLVASLEADKYNPKVKKLCTACFDGKYPTGDIDEDLLEKVAGGRKKDVALIKQQRKLEI